MDPVLPLAAVPAYARRVEQVGFDGLVLPPLGDENDEARLEACVAELRGAG
jgi:hypothetical protein